METNKMVGNTLETLVPVKNNYIYFNVQYHFTFAQIILSLKVDICDEKIIKY